MKQLWALHSGRRRWHRLLSCVAVEPGQRRRALSVCGVTFWAIHGVNPRTGQREWLVYDVQPARGIFCKRCTASAWV